MKLNLSLAIVTLFVAILNVVRSVVHRLKKRFRPIRKIFGSFSCADVLIHKRYV